MASRLSTTSSSSSSSVDNHAPTPSPVADASRGSPTSLLISSTPLPQSSAHDTFNSLSSNSHPHSLSQDTISPQNSNTDKNSLHSIHQARPSHNQPHIFKGAVADANNIHAPGSTPPLSVFTHVTTASRSNIRLNIHTPPYHGSTLQLSSPLLVDSKLAFAKQSTSFQSLTPPNTHTAAPPLHTRPSASPEGGDMISLGRPDQAAMATAHIAPPGSSQSPAMATKAYPQQTAPAGSSTPRTRTDTNSQAKPRETRFGDYVLGRTIGEGEFGKVKMGWKREGSVQVAIKLVRRESIKGNSRQLPKISREIAILKKLKHTHIVRLVEIVETDRHIGIILEYASGGELFDYIYKNRYLKDSSARRLFAQLISGVGYLHKNGIVHRDLKLENLLLDRNNNIIITDFGFANTFDPADEIGAEAESKLQDREFVKASGLDQISEATGFRRGDLMQTSCGSPCYAAPELVVSDSLYTGQKVDVWSCGVILYAMLAGYLPFDDDPENPEGDNIHKLYQYIVSTPLTFPEWVTPHARDLLKRMLVPKPTERADLFEVARHSWLSPYAPLLSSITSAANGTVDPSLVQSGDDSDGPALARSASVREPFKKNTAVSPVGGLVSRHGNINPTSLEEQRKTPKEAKRRTLQIEYVPPGSNRQVSGTKAPERQSSTRERGGSSYSSRAVSPTSRSNIPVRRQPGSASATPSRTTSVRTYRSPSGNHPDDSRAARNNTGVFMNGQPMGQPAPPKAASDVASGYISSPHSRIANFPLGSQPASRTNSQRRPVGLDAREKPPSAFVAAARGHKRSSTVGVADQAATAPASARNSIFGGGRDYTTRPSTESRRMSFGFSRRNSTAANAKPIDTSNGHAPVAPKSRHGSHRLSSFISSTTSLVRTLTGAANRDSQAPSNAVSRAVSPDAFASRRATVTRPPSGSTIGRYYPNDAVPKSAIPVPKSQYASHRNSIASNAAPLSARPTITKVDGDTAEAPDAQAPYLNDRRPYMVDMPHPSNEGVNSAWTPNGEGSMPPTSSHAPPSRQRSSQGGSGQGPARRVMDFFRKRGKRDSAHLAQE